MRDPRTTPAVGQQAYTLTIKSEHQDIYALFGMFMAEAAQCDFTSLVLANPKGEILCEWAKNAEVLTVGGGE